ncbi:CRISPR-associated protein, TM1812 family [Acididesulfobacillus acetoxydans]|uniref:CRISPR-associated protein, TM1812 family n=1 Tax=Acididesulfobacillus acetoxydans TaxID=1561005 RepID=A0A8S0VYA6_9FIRM|nr:TIGR02221 family CRISPR-associated protein [Acididesulfobacillus acetoxydans]CAA7602823.1 CRISPR-associated protein, TM1812 family [Acididesulfobacillus acetoxydans]CEJ05704.1 Conserved domain protein [Acididesulfobacillus acetoxydans]
MGLKLMSFLGTNNYLPCVYRTQVGEAAPRRFIQTALVELFLGDLTQEREIIIFLTREARERNWSRNGPNGERPLEEELTEQLSQEAYSGIRVRTVDVCEGFTIDQMWSIFEVVERNVNVGDQVIFDITHSYRSLPFLSLLLLNYARVFRKIKIEGIVYGAFEALGRRNEVENMPLRERLVDVIDLKEFVRLMDWSAAADHFVKAGDTKDLYGIARVELSPVNASLKTTDENLHLLNRLLKNLHEFSQQAATCRTRTILRDTLPGISQNAVMNKDEPVPYIKALLPILDVVRGKMANMLAGTDIQKANALVRWCLDHDKIQQAWTILRENVISFLCSAVGYEEHGLKAECGRERELITKAAKVLAQNIAAERWENAIKSQSWIVDAMRNDLELLEVAKLLDGIMDYRNDLDHAEYTCKNHRAHKFETVLGTILTKFERIVEMQAGKDPTWPMRATGEMQKAARLLLSPLGLSAGPLFSALRRLAPEHVLVLTSQEADADLPRITEHAEYQGTLQKIVVEDPFTCFQELPQIEAEISRAVESLPNVEIFVNITGGTTALQYAVQEVASSLRDRDYLVHEVAFADRRLADEQKQVPFVEGEMFYLS